MKILSPPENPSLQWYLLKALDLGYNLLNFFLLLKGKCYNMIILFSKFGG